MSPACLGSALSTDDLQAISRSLGFVESLPHDGTIAVWLVYAPDQQGSEALAADAAGRLNGIPGPNSAVFKARPMPIGGMAQSQDTPDALILAPGTCGGPGNADAITDTVRQRKVISISSDPDCLTTKCCVLMVHSDRKVEIVLDTALAEAAGAHFSSVFAMMVKRK